MPVSARTAVRITAAMGVAALAASTLAACQSTADTPSAGGTGGTTSVTIALDWLAQPSSGGTFIAEELGYYDEVGLDVTIQPGGTDASSVKVVGGGGAEFGLEYATGILEGREHGIEVVSLAPTLQISPEVYIFHAGQDITSAADFAGRTVYTQVSSVAWEHIVEQFDLTDVNAVQFQGSYAAWGTDETAVAQGYATSDILTLEDQGFDIGTIPAPNAMGYGSSIFTTQKMIDENPEVVANFVSATVRGWDYMREHPADAAEILAAYIQDSDVETILAQIEALEPYVWTEETLEHGFGYQTAERWDEITELAVDAGYISDSAAAEGAWTTEFLPGAGE